MCAMRQPKDERYERLEARVSREQKELIRRAAELQGRSITDFCVSSAEQAAREVIQSHEILRLSVQGAKAFVEALENPLEPNERLRAAMKRHDQLVSH